MLGVFLRDRAFSSLDLYKMKICVTMYKILNDGYAPFLLMTMQENTIVIETIINFVYLVIGIILKMYLKRLDLIKQILTSFLKIKRTLTSHHKEKYLI